MDVERGCSRLSAPPWVPVLLTHGPEASLLLSNISLALHHSHFTEEIWRGRRLIRRQESDDWFFCHLLTNNATFQIPKQKQTSSLHLFILIPVFDLAEREHIGPSLGWDAVNSIWFIDSLNKCLLSTQSMPGMTVGVGLWGETHAHCPPKVYPLLGIAIKQGITVRQCCEYTRNQSVLQGHTTEASPWKGVVWEGFR